LPQLHQAAPAHPLRQALPVHGDVDAAAIVRYEYDRSARLVEPEELDQLRPARPRLRWNASWPRISSTPCCLGRSLYLLPDARAEMGYQVLHR